MTHVDLDDLADLVLDPDATPAPVREHVETCAVCTDRMAALLDVRRLAVGGPLVAPPSRVRDQVLAHVRDRHPGPGTTPTPLDAAPIPLDAARQRRDQGRRRRVPAWAAGLAAAAALVAGLGLGRLTGEPEQPEAVPPGGGGTVVAATALTALDSDSPRGEASAVRSDDTTTLRVRANALGDEDGFHEVWLINVDGSRMVALGVLAEGDTGEFEVPNGLIDEGYRIVDISVEPDDGDPTHSGVSLARGELT